MPFVGLGNDYVKSGYTSVDNVFLLSYLPTADPLDVKIYLYGLALATSGQEEDNSMEKMSLALHVDEDRILRGYRYWEDKGLVSLTKTVPASVRYLSVKTPMRPVVKRSVEKYAVFNEEVVRLFPDRIVIANEFEAYYEFMETYKLEPNAMLLIMQYCKEMGAGKLYAPYILSVADSWAKQGLTTEKKIIEHIQELENNSEDLRQIFAALGTKRGANLEDRQLFLKWNKKYGYNLDSILTAAKSQKKRGGMEKLDEIIEELNRTGAHSAEEVAKYLSGKENARKLAMEISKALGTYYGSPEAFIETYLQPWLNLGFEEEALVRLAKFCFIRNIRSYDGLNQIVERFYKIGILTDKGVEAYVLRQSKIDEDIRKIFDSCNRFGTINNRDRESYRIWEEWGFSLDAIIVVAEHYADSAFPFQLINRTLADLRNRNVFDVEGIKKALGEKKVKTAAKKDDDYMKHEYSEEQIANIPINVDLFDEEWVD